MPKMKKKDINSSVSVPGVKHGYRFKDGRLEVDNGELPCPMARRDVRKLTRAVSSPTTRNEKPYLNLKSQIIGVRGGTCYNHTSNQRYHNVQVGDLQGEVFGASPKNFSAGMGFPNLNPRYLPQAGEWPMNPDLLSQAEIKCYAALRNKYGELDIDSYLSFGIWYGERRELASLLKGAGLAFGQLVAAVKDRKKPLFIKGLRSFRVAVKRGQVNRWWEREIESHLRRKKERERPGTALRTADVINNAILTWNLGVSPLLNDLDKVYKACRYDTVKDPSSLLIKAKGWEQRQEVNTEVVSTDRGHVKVKTNVNHLVRYTSVMVARPSLTDRALLERLGIGNPASLAAELTTLSFMVNYAYGILDYLKAVSTPQAFEFVDGSWSKRISHLQWVEITSSSSSGNRKAAGRWYHLEYKRTVYGKFPFPIPPLSLKSEDNNLRQDTNVATVTWSRVRKALGS